jgi:predicted transglutaminase-like cysteine proteinase
MAERILRVKFSAGTSLETRFNHTVKLLQELIEDGMRDEFVRRRAIEIVNRAGILGHDELGEIRAICKWVQNNVTYRKDPFEIEYFQTARRLLKDVDSGRSAADCDDFVILAASLLGSLGYPTGALIVDSNGDGVLNHVMVTTRTFAPTQQFGTKWIVCELIFPDFELGESVKVSEVIPLVADPNTTRTPIMKQTLRGVKGVLGNATLSGYQLPHTRLLGYLQGKF